MGENMSTRLSFNRGNYTGTNVLRPPETYVQPRDPTQYDARGYSLLDQWLNSVTLVPWVLVSLQGTSSSKGPLATWIDYGGGGVVTETLTGNNSSVHVPPTGNNINIVGDNVGVYVTGVVSGSTLTISLLGGGIATQTFHTDNGTAVPTSMGAITFNAASQAGASVSFSGASNTVSLNMTDANQNTVIGLDTAGGVASSAFNNVVLGYKAANSLSGSDNTFIGFESGFAVTGGADNVLVGYRAGYNYNGTEGSNIVISSDTGGSGTTGESHVLRLGSNGSGNGQQNKCYVAGVDGVNVGSVATVVTEYSNQLGTAVITAGSGISVTPGANTITIAATGSSSISISGDSGTIPLTGNAFTFTGGSTGLTFTGSTGPNTETLGGILAIANGGTNASSMANTDGVVYFDGTRLVTTAAGTSGYVLTSQGGAGSPPVFQQPLAASCSFLAYIATSTTNTISIGFTTIPFNATTPPAFNNGSPAPFNTSTYTFTAPATGLYYISSGVGINTIPNTITEYTVIIAVSGTSAGNYILNNNSGYASSATSGQSMGTAASLILQMTAGDTLIVQLLLGGSGTAGWTGLDSGGYRTYISGYRVL